ncbi:Tfp pilus assembly protein FimT/FimU [Deinococcus oregonensis]|uniref:Tfp pilus assembly protein FimT/FimU n=1 Tax=Deinococcus oregonensis TaxID=1805970 RepID=A0ABV6B158_9DEIO
MKLLLKSPVVRNKAGFTTIELLIVMAIIGILTALGVQSYLSTRNPARDAARAVHATLFQLRSNAVSNTQARRMILNSSQQLVMQSAVRCSETDASKWTDLGTVPLSLNSYGRLVQLSTTTPGINPVVVCFTSRGLAAPSGRLTLREGTRIYNVDVALGGGVRTSGS